MTRDDIRLSPLQRDALTWLAVSPMFHEVTGWTVYAHQGKTFNTHTIHWLVRQGLASIATGEAEITDAGRAMVEQIERE